MNNKIFTKLIALAFGIVFFTSVFAGCSSDRNADSGAVVKQTLPPLEWVIEPVINAQNIEPLVRADFNEKTAHYDISYADWFKIKAKGKYGIIDINGDILVPADYDDIFAIRNSKDFIAVKNNGDIKEQTYISYGDLDTAEAHRKYNSYRYVYYWDRSASVPVCIYRSSDSKEEKELKPVLPETVEGVVIYDGKYKTTGEYGLYADGKNITGLHYEGAGCFNEGVAAFESNGKWGYLDAKGRTVVPFQYDYIKGYSAFGEKDTPYESFGNYITVSRDGKFGFIKNNGTPVSELEYDRATPVVNGRAFVKSQGRWGMVQVDRNVPAGHLEAPSEIPAEIPTVKPTVTTTEKAEENTEEENTEYEYDENSYEGAGNYKVEADGDYLSLRTGPGMEYPSIAAIPDLAELYVDRISGEWGHTEYNGTKGWFKIRYAVLQ